MLKQPPEARADDLLIVGTPRVVIAPHLIVRVGLRTQPKIEDARGPGKALGNLRGCQEDLNRVALSPSQSGRLLNC